jgi:hypothetical protein
VTDLQAEIAKRFGAKYGISSLYRVLSIGKDKQYEVKDGRWKARKELEVKQ